MILTNFTKDAFALAYSDSRFVMFFSCSLNMIFYFVYVKKNVCMNDMMYEFIVCLYVCFFLFVFGNFFVKYCFEI